MAKIHGQKALFGARCARPLKRQYYECEIDLCEHQSCRKLIYNSIRCHFHKMIWRYFDGDVAVVVATGAGDFGWSMVSHFAFCEHLLCSSAAL